MTIRYFGFGIFLMFLGVVQLRYGSWIYKRVTNAVRAMVGKQALRHAPPSDTLLRRVKGIFFVVLAAVLFIKGLAAV